MYDIKLLAVRRIAKFTCCCLFSYNVRLRCADNGVPSKSIEKDITIRIIDVNEAPSGIILTSGVVSENQGPVSVGRLVVTDPDRTQQRFALSVTTRNLPFYVVGNTLRTTGPLNFEKKHAYRLSIKAVDQGGKLFVWN